MEVQLGAAKPVSSGARLGKGGVMANEVERRGGHCPEHGVVEAAREIPKMGFPFIYFAIARAMARRRPFRCPDCGRPVTT